MRLTPARVSQINAGRSLPQPWRRGPRASGSHRCREAKECGARRPRPAQAASAPPPAPRPVRWRGVERRPLVHPSPPWCRRTPWVERYPTQANSGPRPAASPRAGLARTGSPPGPGAAETSRCVARSSAGVRSVPGQTNGSIPVSAKRRGALVRAAVGAGHGPSRAAAAAAPVPAPNTRGRRRETAFRSCPRHRPSAAVGPIYLSRDGWMSTRGPALLPTGIRASVQAGGPCPLPLSSVWCGLGHPETASPRTRWTLAPGTHPGPDRPVARRAPARNLGDSAAAVARPAELVTDIATRFLCDGSPPPWPRAGPQRATGRFIPKSA